MLFVSHRHPTCRNQFTAGAAGTKALGLEEAGEGHDAQAPAEQV